MNKLIIHTSDHAKVLQQAYKANKFAFYVGSDGHAVSGTQLSAKIENGAVIVTSNSFSKEDLYNIFRGFLPE